MRTQLPLAVLSVGTVAVFAGAACLVVGLAFALTAAAPSVPTWAALLIIGIVVACIGVVMVERGGTETVEEVGKTFTVAEQAKQHPYVVGGIAIGLGLLVYGIVRAVMFPTKVVEAKEVPEAAKEMGMEMPTSVRLSAPPPPSSIPTPPPAKTEPTFWESVGDQLTSLANMAQGAAVSMGLQAAGIPSLQEVIDKVFGDLGKGEDEKAKEKVGATHNGVGANGHVKRW